MKTNYSNWFKGLTLNEQVRVVYLGISFMVMMLAGCIDNAADDFKAFVVVALAIANLANAVYRAKDIKLPELNDVEDFKF